MQLFSRRMFLVAAVFLAMPLRLALAADVEFPAPDTAVSAYGITTYLDLARHFVPDIKPSDSGYVGRKRITLRHIGGKNDDNDEARTFGFYDIATLKMQADGKDRLLILFDFAQASDSVQGVAVLALYDVTKDITLLDAADIGFDQSTYFFDQALMPVANGTDVILTMSTHFNSSQTYTTQSMIMVHDDRLQLIDTVSLFNDKLCAVERQQNIRYAANPGAAAPYAPIAVTVTETVTRSQTDCDNDATPPLGTKEIHVIYKWNVASRKYIKDSDALENLAKANERRF